MTTHRATVRLIEAGAALAASVGLVSSCGSQDAVTGSGRAHAPAFVREPAEGPVITSGLAGWPTIVADASVIADEEGYHLFYSAFFCRRQDGSYSFSWDPDRPQECDLSRAFGATAYGFSRDRGRSWELRTTPVVPPGAGDWNDGDIETPFACRLDDRLYVFYSALGRGGPALRHRYQLGVAALPLRGRSIRDALLATDERFVHSAEPVVAADFVTRHGINNAQEPSVVVQDGRFELYFVSLGLSSPGQDVVAPGQELSLAFRLTVLDRDLSVLQPPSEPLLTGASANITEVRRFDGRYHLFATTTEKDDHENDWLTYRASDDGRRFTAPETILQRRPGDTFDNWGVMAPTVVAEPDALVLFYTAWEMLERRCDTNARLGMPQESRPAAARCLYATLGRAVAPRTP